nr:reverse transcriptase domain-containing protein [Tanacetum cinerariifolium]
MAAAAVTSPTRVLELDTHSSLEFGPSESSLPPVPEAPMVSPFLCSDDPEPNTELPERHVSFAPHDAMLARWRIRLPPLLIHLHHRDLFIHHLLGLHGIARPIAVGVPTRIDLLPPRKRFRDSISPEDSIMEDIDADVLADIEANIAAAEAATGMDVEAGTDVGISIEADVGVDREYEVESSPRGTIEVRMDRVIDPVVANDIDEPISEDYFDLISVDGSREVMQLGLDVAMQELYDHMHEIPVDRITDIEIMTITRSDTTVKAIKDSLTNEWRKRWLIMRQIMLLDCLLKVKAKIEMTTTTEMAGEMETKMVGEMETKIKEEIGIEIPIGMTKGNVVTAEPTRLQDAVMIDIKLMDQKLKGYDVRNAENKIRDCMNAVVAPATQRAPVVNQRVPTCFECGRQGNYRNECPKLKIQNHGNKAGNKTNKSRGKEYVLGGGETNFDSNVVTGMFLLNNHYASMLFDSGADGSFVSSIFSALLDVIPSILDVSYVVELADERVAKTSTTVEVNLRGLLGLGKMNSVVMNIKISLVPSDLSPSSPS